MALSRVYLGVHYPSDIAAGALLGTIAGSAGAMKVGIVGMPNAGKSSLFNALTRAGAEAANYPFTTIEPNVAVVPVADERLDAVAETVGASNIVPDTIDFHDIAGLVARRAQGRGPRQPVPRQHPRDRRDRPRRARAPRRRTSSTPRAASTRWRDIETIETELIYADLEQAERRLDRVVRAGARRRPRRDRRGGAGCARSIDALQAGPPGAHRAGARRTRRTRCATSHPLTAKPVLFVANVDEGDDECPPAVAEHAAAQGAVAVAVSSRLEAELSELDDEDADAMRADLGVAESGLQRVVRGAFDAARADRVLHRRRGQAGAVLAPAPRR